MRRCAGSPRAPAPPPSLRRSRGSEGGDRRHQCRRQQGSAGSHRRLCAADRAFRRGGELCHGQCFVAQYARLAQHAASGGAGRSAGARHRRPRAGRAACRADAGAAQDRARSFACRSRRHCRHCAVAPGRRHDRRQYDGVAPAGLARRRKAKEAGGLSGRPLLPLSTRMLAETYVRVEGVFPLIGAGGIDSGAARWPRSAPAPALFSSIRDWCSAASA